MYIEFICVIYYSMVMDKDHFGSRIRLRHLQCFVCIAQERNLGKAADKLRLSQPAISKTLTELEALVGARLFERGAARRATDARRRNFSHACRLGAGSA